MAALKMHEKSPSCIAAVVEWRREREWNQWPLGQGKVRTFLRSLVEIDIPGPFRQKKCRFFEPCSLMKTSKWINLLKQ